MLLTGIKLVVCAHLYCPCNFIEGRRCKFDDFYYFMKTGLPLKIILVTEINGIRWQIAILFFVLICFKTSKFVTFVI